MDSEVPRRVCAAAFGIIMAAADCPALADVVTDGTAGPALELAGPRFAIGADLGTRAGANLFHSFSRFSLAAGERATFSGPAELDHVIARVTGGEPSAIDGQLRSTIAGADLYFVNPAGVLFGPNASLDVTGSFHASTADEVRFADGEVFSARAFESSSFSVAAPEAFGFLARAPAALTVDRSALAVPAGETPSLSGGALTISGDPERVEVAPDGSLTFGRFLLAPDGQAVLAALGDRGTLAPATGAATGATGRIVIENAAFVGTSGNHGGSIVVAGGDLAIDQSILIAANLSPAADATGGIALRGVGELRLTDSIVQTGADGLGRAGVIEVDAGQLVLDGAQLDASSFGRGTSGTVAIATTGRIEIAGQPEGLLFGPESFVRAGVFANGRGFGSGGRIEIDAPALVMSDGALLDAGTFGSAPAGSIELDLGRLALTGGAQVLVATEGAGAGGELVITATDRIAISGPNMRNPRGTLPARDRSGLLAGSGFLLALPNTLGDAGTIRIDTPLLALDDLALIDAGTWTDAAGRGGTIAIEAGTVEIAGGSQIGNSARSIGEAAGGGLRISAADRIRIHGAGVLAGGEELRSGLFGDALGSPAGDLVLETGELIVNGGRITSDTTSAADAGVIRIGAPAGVTVRLVIRNEGQIFAGTDAGGDGADIVIEDGGTIEIAGTSDAAGASPDVNPQPTGIFSNVKRNGEGDGGDITINAERLLMRQGAAISSQTFGTGAAGGVKIILTGGATVDDSVVETAVAEISNAPTAGGQVTIIGGRLIDLNQARITTNGVIPAPGSSVLTLDAAIVAINRSTVTSLTAAGEPLPGVRSGVVVIIGDSVLISSDSLVAATSSLELSGVDEELGTKLVVLPVGFVDASTLLRERCAARRDVGASSFTGMGRGGLRASPDEPLGSAYRARADRSGAAAPAVSPATLTLAISCPGAL